MWVDRNPYLFIYLLGSIFVVILTLLKLLIFWILSWATKENNFNKNACKLIPPDEKTASQKTILFIRTLIFESLFSWINVIVIIWQILTTTLKIIREILTSTTEEIKQLRYPLRNNPNLPPETAWAYLIALQFKAHGKLLDESEIIFLLNEVYSYRPSFNREQALIQLKNLNIVNPNIISSCLLNFAFHEN